ncbi:MAG TPA: methyltransferase [Rhodocyclaceae bacterium]|nr:methyltransferase [Rhodocyclaceae bacterium]
MSDLIAFALGTAVLLWFSRHPLRHPGGHGFYRFFAWEAILGLVVLNYRIWGEQPFSPHQLVSWVLIAASIYLVHQGVTLLRGHGAASAERDEGGLYGFERTTTLVRHGVFRYIRHPMYASLLALAWGAYFQDPALAGAILASAASLFLVLTAKADERECARYFGPVYVDYMKQTKMFVPFVL